MAADRSARAPLGAFDLGCVVVGGIIGVGIFFTPQKVAAAVDHQGQVIAAWSLGGLMAIIGALVFADLARRVPGHGGTFVYIERAFGGMPAFLYGWANWLVIQSGALGLIGVIMARYLDRAIHGSNSELPMDVTVALAATAILLFTALNLLGLRVGKWVQNALTVTKTLAVFSLVALALILYGDRPEPVAAASQGQPRGWLLAMAGAMLPVLFSFGGWQQGAFVAGAVRRPRRDVPAGIVGGVVVVVLAYVTVNLAFLDLLGFGGAARSTEIADAAARAAMAPFGYGDLAGRAISVAVVISALGIMNTICMAPPFVLHAMSKSGLFFPSVGRLHPRTGAPSLAVLVQGLWSFALLVGVYLIASDPVQVLDFLLTGVVFVDWLFYGACGLALWRLRSQHREGARGRALPLSFAVLALAVMMGAFWTAPVSSLSGLAICALGVPTFFWMRRRSRQISRDRRSRDH